MKNDQEKTFEEAIKDVPWSRILVPFFLALFVAALFVFFADRTAAQERVVINCIYDDQKSIAVCEMPVGTRVIPIDWSDETFSEWLYQTQLRGSEVDYNLPLVKVRPKHGAILKAELQEDNEWSALAGCEVRVQRKLHAWAKAKPGQIPPGPLWEKPADCQPEVKQQARAIP